MIELLSGILLAVSGIFGVIFLRLITTFFHEMGHAIPALLFTNKKVTVYVGSYGDISNTLALKFGRLQLYLRINVFDWKVGMCQHEGATDWWKRLLIILGGPIASLLIAIPLIWALITTSLSPLLFSVFVVFTGAAVIDFFTNMIPVSTPIMMHDGTMAYNDGTAMMHLIYRQTLSKEYIELETQFEDKNCTGVIRAGQAMIDAGSKDHDVYHLVALAYAEDEQYEKALDIYFMIDEYFNLSYQDYYQIGKICLKTGDYEEAKKCFNHCFQRDFSNYELRYNIAYTNVQLGANQASLIDFDYVITNHPTYVNAYIYKAQALMNLNEFEAAYTHLQVAQNIDDQAPMLHFYLGKYYEQEYQLDKALLHYQKAEQLGCDHYGLAYHIEHVKR